MAWHILPFGDSYSSNQLGQRKPSFHTPKRERHVHGRHRNKRLAVAHHAQKQTKTGAHKTAYDDTGSLRIGLEFLIFFTNVKLAVKFTPSLPSYNVNKWIRFRYIVPLRDATRLKDETFSFFVPLNRL